MHLKKIICWAKTNSKVLFALYIIDIFIYKEKDLILRIFYFQYFLIIVFHAIGTEAYQIPNMHEMSLLFICFENKLSAAENLV